MKELKKISKLFCRSKIIFHKVIFISVTRHLRILHLWDFFLLFWSPSTSYFQISKLTTPKTLLSQMTIYSLIRSIYKNLSNSVIYLRGYLSTMAKTYFLYSPSAWPNKSPKLDPVRIFLHRANIISIIRRIYNPPRGRFHLQPFLFTTI